MLNDTIAAISTALGEAGIGIVRISGPEAIGLADKIFRGKGRKSLANTPNFRMRYGKVVDLQGKVIDEVLVAIMRGPHSFTGEDVVEFQCHGGIVVIHKILELILACGARAAERGEFTKRAFLNGRLDLSQAEAVIDIIRSKTEASLDIAIGQLEGSLGRRIQNIREKLYDIIVRVEASIDFPEDDIPEVEYEEIAQIIMDSTADITKLIATANDGKVFREGLKTVITGKPNVGKSSLLNRLLDENRALVTDIPGTTRDVIEEVLNLNGIPLRLLDTAGIRDSDDLVEQMGVQRALELVDQADLVLHVLDISSDLLSSDRELLAQTANHQRVIIINKIDLPAKWQGRAYLLAEGIVSEETPIIEISLAQDSLDPLIDLIIGLIKSGMVYQSSEGAIVTRSRHKQALIEAKTDLEQALHTLKQGLPIDLIAIGIQGALEHLGEITGETVRDNMIDRIFAQFCIGK